MEIRISRDDVKGRAEIDGNIDEKGAEAFKARIKELTNLKEVTIDFRNVDYVGSSGIGKLLLFYKNVAVNGGKIKVVNVKPDLLRLFRELKLDTIFSITGR